MQRPDLEHIIRAAGAIVEEKDLAELKDELPDELKEIALKNLLICAAKAS